MDPLIWVVFGGLLLIGFLIEMMTYSVGDAGMVTRWYHSSKKVHLDLIIGAAIAGWMIWKGSTFVAVIGVVAFLVFGIKAAIRVDRQLLDETEVPKERS